MQLAVADVHGVHPPGAALEQKVRKAAGRCAHVQSDFARGIDAPDVERLVELQRAAADVFRALANQLDGRVIRDAVRRPRGDAAVHEHRAGQDQRLGALARLGQAALNEDQV